MELNPRETQTFLTTALDLLATLFFFWSAWHCLW
jgi:hypothetical protein